MKPTLLVLAAGMGSRFGGLKQMEPVGPSGEWILDYSVHDALAAGFDKVVFVIREEMAPDFRPLIDSKYGDKIQVAYAYQKPDDLPIAVANAEQRSKPWGTGHAVYAARHALDAPFAVINADDFYGREAFDALAKFLGTPQTRDDGKDTYAIVGYELANTLSENGSVSRGVCRLSANGELESIEEHTQIQQTDKGIDAADARGTPTQLAPDTIVSLNCWGFPAGWAGQLESLFVAFLLERGHEPKSEFYLPAAVDALIGRGQAIAKTLPCKSRWLGVTYREDLPVTRQEIAQLIQAGAYATPLWNT